MIPDDGTNALKIFKARPECYIYACTEKGFHNINQKSKTCPSITICDQSLALVGADHNVLKNVNISCVETGEEIKEININTPTLPTDYTFMFLLGFIFMIVVAGYIIMDDDEDDKYIRRQQRPRRRRP